MSQNQFPGQGGQQYPQQGGGQQYPQQGGQQYPQGGQPNPQQGGYPPGGGYPQGGQQYPQGYPPGQQPGQGGRPYPQQGGGYPPSGQYPPAGASGPFGGQAAMGSRPGYPGGGGGFQPQPPKPKSNGMVIGIVVAGLAAVALAGWLLMSIFGSGGGDPTPSVSPTASAPSTPPTPQPSPSTSTDPTPQPSPSTSTTNDPPAGATEVGLGVSVVPADGWQQSSRNELKNYTELSNGKALLATQAFRVEGQVTGKDIVAAYMKQITANMTGVSSKPPATMDVKTDRLSVGIGSWSGTRATAQGSIKLSYVSIISVRDDGLAVMSTLILPPGVGLDSVQADYTAMTNSMLNSQLAA